MKKFIITLFTLLALSPALSFADWSTDSLQGYWKFDGPDITNIRDYSGNGRTANATLSSVVGGQLINGLKIAQNGTTTYPTYTGYTYPTSQTISFWIKPDNNASATYESVIWDGNPSNISDSIRLVGGASGNSTIVYRNHSSGHGSTCGTIQNNVWTHIAFVYDDSTVSSYCFINSVKSALFTGGTFNFFPITIAYSTVNTGGDSFAIDDIRDYRRVLSQAEITRLYLEQPNKIIANYNPAKILQAISNLSLVGYWPLEEGGGISTGDFSGNGYTGKLVNSPTWVPGKVRKAIKTNGSNNYVTMGNPANLQFTASDAFSISVWAKPAALGGANTYLGIFGDNQDVTDGWGVFQINGFGICTHCFDYCYFPGVYYGCATSDSNSVRAGQWTHIVVTNDTSNLRVGRKMYINGVLQTGHHEDGSLAGDGIPDINYTGNVTTIGYRYGAAGTYYNGTTDQVRVWGRELSQAEVSALYREQSSMFQ